VVAEEAEVFLHQVEMGEEEMGQRQLLVTVQLGQ
jgi:hypothetical protein